LKRERLIDAVTMAIPVVIATIAIAQSWNGWLDPIIDTGRDLYIPEQLRHGLKLYRDVLYYYPPLTPYLLAVKTAFIGSSLSSYVAIGIGTVIATMIAIYALARVVCGRWGAAGAASLFAACSIAGRSTWGTNYMFPYAHAATLGMLFFVAFAACLAAYLFADRRSIWIAAALGFAIAASWTKIEYAVFTVVVLAFAAIVHRIERGWVGTYVIGMAVTAGVAIAYFGRALVENVEPPSMLGSPHLRAFYAAVAGFDDWPRLLLKSAIAAVMVAGYVACAHYAESSRLRWVAIVAPIVFGFALLTYEDGFFRAWTVLQIAWIPFAFRRLRDPITLVLVVSLCTTSRVFFNIVPVWYGFVFVVPLYVFAVCAMLRFASPRFVMPLIAAVSALYLAQANESYARKTHVVTTARGVFKDAVADRAKAIAELERIPMHSLVAIPEGLTLNYLLRIPTPLAYHTFTPAETDDATIEARIIADFEAKRPECVVLVPRSLREFGAQRFGIDYDRRLAAYLRARYVAVGRTGGPDYSLLVLRRRP